MSWVSDEESGRISIMGLIHMRELKFNNSENRYRAVVEMDEEG